MELPIQSHPFFVSRSPLLPYQQCMALSSEKLQQLYQNPVLQEALFIASPDLYEVFVQWQNGTLTDKKGIEKLELTLTKYLLRMAYRCTPFGLFAGIAVGTIQETANLHVAEIEQCQRQNRLDMDYLCALALELGKKPHIRQQLRYFPNSTLYQMGSQFRYAEYRIHKKLRSHHLVNVEWSEHLDTLLTAAHSGATMTELITVLLSDEISVEDAEAFLEVIIDSQLLVSELEPIITGKDYLQHLIEVLQSKPDLIPEALLLQKLSQAMNTLQIHPLGKNVARYQQIAQYLMQLGVDFELGQLFQVDMYKPTTAHALPAAVADELQKTIQVLYQLNPPNEKENLRAFKQVFAERYEGREIPLNEVIDAETGIGYPVSASHHTDNNPLLTGIMLGKTDPVSESHTMSAWKQFLMQKYIQAVQTSQTEIKLTEEEIKPFLQTPSRSLPPSFYSICSVLADTTDSLDAGHFQVFHRSTAGPSAANLLGRFCYLDDTLTQYVQQALQTEQSHYPEACLAEIIHINQARIGNVAIRPVLRAYEIPILVQAGVDEAHTLPLHDLRVSIRRDRVVLRSQKLNREVIPRMSNAHNYSQLALPCYHFLCDLQHQNLTQGIRWDWGVLQHASFLPRVSHGKVIVSKARWVLDETDTQYLASATLEQIAALRQKRHIPRFVTISEGDNELPIDLEDSWSIKLLRDFSKKQKNLTLEENLFQTDNLCVQNTTGKFTNELIIPWECAPQAVTIPAKPKTESHTVTRSFSMGSEWLYIKVYGGIKTADTLLTEVIYPLTVELLQERTIDAWFFIRYNDPKNHLRLRFHGSGAFYGRVIERLHAALKPYADRNLISSIQADTYHRELERYGHQTIEEAEKLFFHDSVAVSRILGLLDGDAGDDIRWQLALRGIDQLLTDIGLLMAEKKHLLEKLQASFKQEFNATTVESRKSLANKYRQHRIQIENTLKPDYSSDDELAAVWQIFDERSHHWHLVIDHLRRRYQTETAEVPLLELLSSYIHMFVNRFFRSRQRMHELVLYDFLFQYYTSMLARNK